MVQRPNAVGLTLCQLVIVEETTRNVTLASSFQRLKAVSFPSQPFPFFAYTVLSDGLGDIDLTLVVLRCDTLEAIYTRSSKISFADPLRQLRLYWQLRSCSFPVPGTYEFGLLADGEPITQSVLRVMQKGTGSA
jgi:hypothetical protein